jgi:hypothetical protein
VIPPQQRFEPVDFVGFQDDEGLVIELELFAGERLAQVHFQLPPHFHARIHLGLEESERPAPVALGVIERHVCIAQKLIRLDGIHRRNGNADADIGNDLMPLDLIGLDDRVADAFREGRRPPVPSAS